jgi:MFS family permease
MGHGPAKTLRGRGIHDHAGGASLRIDVMPARTTPAGPTTRGAQRAIPYPSQRRAAYVICVLFIVALLSQLDRQLPALLVRPLRQEFGLSDTAFSLLQGYAFALSFTLAGLPLGRWVDRGQRRNLLAAGLLFWSAATALFAFGRSHEMLLLARVGVGVGEAVLAPAAYSLIADLVPAQRRGRALAVYGVSLAVGSGASLLLGGWLLAVIPAQGLALPGIGAMPAWRLTFVAAALPGLPLAVLLLLTVREPARQQDTIAPAAGDGAGQPSVADFVNFLRAHPATVSRILTYPTLLALNGYGALAWAPALFERSHGLPPAQSGMVLGFGVAVAGTIGMLTGGIFSDRWAAQRQPAARLRVAGAGMLLAALPAVSWPLVPGVAAAFSLLFLMVAGIALAQSAVPTTIQAVFPNRMRGQAVALSLLLSGLLGIGLGPTAVALVTDLVFRDDQALRYAIAWTSGPASLLGLWLVGSGLAPYARTQELLQPGGRA